MRAGNTACLGGHVCVQISIWRFLLDQKQYLIALRHRFHHGFVAHLEQQRIAFAALRFKARLIKWRLAHLNHVMLDCLFLRPEAHQVTIRKQRKSMAGNTLGNFLFNQPIGHQGIQAGHTIEKDVQIIFSVRRGHGPFQQHFAFFGLVTLQLAALEIVAIRKDQAMLFGQQDAGLSNRIHTVNGLQLFVKNKIPGDLLPVGRNFDQDQRALNSVLNLSIVQLLVTILHRFRVNAVPRGCIVLDLDREIAAHTFHKNPILNRYMRIVTMPNITRRGVDPLEIKLRRKRCRQIFVGRSIIVINQLAISINQPLINCDIPHFAARAEHNIKV